MAQLKKGWNRCTVNGCDNKSQFRMGWEISEYCEWCDRKISMLTPVGWDTCISQGYPWTKGGVFIIEYVGKGTNGKNRRVVCDFGEVTWTDLGIEDEEDPRKHADPRPKKS